MEKPTEPLYKTLAETTQALLDAITSQPLYEIPALVLKAQTILGQIEHHEQIKRDS